MPGPSPACGKPVIARFDGGKLSSDGAAAGVEARLPLLSAQILRQASAATLDAIRHAGADTGGHEE